MPNSNVTRTVMTKAVSTATAPLSQRPRRPRRLGAIDRSHLPVWIRAWTPAGKHQDRG